MRTVPYSVSLYEHSVLIDGRPAVVMAGEIHYFRIAPEQWLDRLQKLQANGLNTVATYIPWIWHELDDEQVDLTGRTHPQRDLLAFLQLCSSQGLYVIARPGPFIMAELKNEGIPYRLYDEDSIPVTWDAKKITTRTLDYLSPVFLAAVKGWYQQVMPLLAENLAINGGPIIAVQLDNEIGMLSWVSNSPDLTDEVCEDIKQWSSARYGVDMAAQKLGQNITAAPQQWRQALRSPDQGSLSLHYELGLYMRDRYRRYVQTLRDYAEENGVKGVPFLINIHGSGGGRGKTFPIGISQLFETFKDQPQMTAGTDFYLGDLTVTNLPDLYLANAFMNAVLNENQPLSALEFEAGNGDYNEDLSVLYSPEAVELKTALCIAQGNRIFNYYLQAGGENPPFEKHGDGIERLAFTGQRQGFAAPVGPEGKLNATYAPLSRAVAKVTAAGAYLADAVEEHDGFAIGFVPDHYLTEYSYPGSQERAAHISDLERYRGSGPRDILTRALLFCGFSFPAVNLQASCPSAASVKAMVVCSGKVLGRKVQENLVEYLLQGGRLLLVGLLPDTDDDGTSCTLLSEALGLKSAGRLNELGFHNGGPYWPSVTSHDSLSPQPEVRVTTVQLLAHLDDQPFEPLLTEIESQKPCAVHVQVGAGEAIMLGCDYPAHLDFYRGLMSSLGIEPRWNLHASDTGVAVTSTLSKAGHRFLHLLNVAPHAVSFTLHHNGKRLFGGKHINVAARSGLMLPVKGQFLSDVSIVGSTAEFVRCDHKNLVMRPTQDRDLIILKTNRKVQCSKGLVRRRGTVATVTLDGSKKRDKEVTIKFN